MANIFNSIINTMIRNLDMKVRIIIGFCLFIFAIFSLKKSIRKKNDKAPIAWGWMIFFVLSTILSILYFSI